MQFSKKADDDRPKRESPLSGRFSSDFYMAPPPHHIVFDATLPESYPDHMHYQMYPQMDLGIRLPISGVVAEETTGIAKTRLIGHRFALDQDKMNDQPLRTDATEEIIVELQQIRCLKKKASFPVAIYSFLD